MTSSLPPLGPLSLVIVEDVEDDAELLVRQLERSDCPVRRWVRVDTREGLIDALRNEVERPDAILSDYHVPGFGALEALDVVAALGLDLPFLVVSAFIGEEAAVDLLRLGAHDFVSKANPARLATALAREVTEARVRAEHREARVALERIEARQRAIANCATEGILLVDPSGLVTYANARAEAMLGAPETTLLGTSLADRIDAIASTVARLLEGWRGEGARVPVTLVGIADQHLSCSISGRSLPDDDALLLMITDVTEVEAARASLERSEHLRALGLMAAGIAHDLKNVLTPLSMHLQLLERADDDPAVRAESVSRMRGAVRRGTELIEGLRRFSTGASAHPHPIDPAVEVERALALLEPRILRSQVLVTRHLERGSSLRVEAAELMAAVLNLLTNALDAMGAGTIAVSCIGDDEEVVIEVRDSGPGMSPDALARAEQPFFTTKAEGTGLGLAMVRGFALRSGGRLELTSQPGEGTRAKLIWPVEPETGAAP